jgi:hypothetical protein
MFRTGAESREDIVKSVKLWMVVSEIIVVLFTKATHTFLSQRRISLPG